MADYFASLERVIALPYRRYLPAHGGPIADGPAYARALAAHRQGRNAQLLAAVAAGARTIGAAVSAIYPRQPPRFASPPHDPHGPCRISRGAGAVEGPADPVWDTYLTRLSANRPARP